MLILIGFGMEGVVEDVCEGWEKHNKFKLWLFMTFILSDLLLKLFVF